MKCYKEIFAIDEQIRNLMKQLNRFFESKVEVPRMLVGEKQTIETLINEEPLLLAKFLRNERKMWTPRNASIQNMHYPNI